ncbi:MAG: rhamnulokinase family protein, partial [Pirellulales bacterium]
QVAVEATNASTTQCYNPTKRDWAFELLERLELPREIFGPVVEPGTSLGPIRNDIRGETGLAADVEVVLPATHDTASAVLAVPATTGESGAPPDWCYISSGTWSLMGMEVRQPVLSPACLRHNFTNEGGVGGTIRLLKNIAGLWLLQECRRAWQREGRAYDWEQIGRAAEEAEPLVSLIDPDDPSLVAPDDMPATIRKLCAARGEKVPATDGAVARCALESLALKSRQVLQWLQEITETQLRTIHIVGGGARNRLLCQMTADACKLPVIAGPFEATAVGNLMMQAVAAGVVGSVDEARTVIRDSFDVVHYRPRNPQAWDDAFARFGGR